MDTSGRVGGHCQACVEPRSWSIRLCALPDELLSSYLVRSAHAHGMHPMRFTSLYFPGAQVWTRDIDLHVREPVLNAIARAANLPLGSLKSMTLTDLIPTRSGEHDTSCGRAKWVTSVGMHGRSRTRFGLRYCEGCLRADNAFLRPWRLTFTFACRAHHRMLEDRCYACGAPVVPHRARCLSSICHRCGTPLGGSSENLSSSVVDDALKVQDKFLYFCERDEVMVADTLVDTSDFFVGVGLLLKILREKMHSRQRVFDTVDRAVLDSHDALRLSGTAIRLRLFTRVLDIIEHWPDEFLRIAAASGMTQAAFAHYGNAPLWLADQIKLLPERLRPHYTYQGTTLVKRVRQIEADGGTHCRERRARELMTAARKWS